MTQHIQIASWLAERARGRVFSTAGREFDRSVVRDYPVRRRSILG